MDIYKRISYIFILLAFCNCNNQKDKNNYTNIPPKVNDQSAFNVNEVLQVVLNNNGKLNDSSTIIHITILKEFYQTNDFARVWSKSDHYTKLADSLQLFIEKSMLYGLFPEDYHYSQLKKIRKKLTDSSTLNKTSLLSQSDILYTDAFFLLAEHLKKGRLIKDSITLSADSILQNNFYTTIINDALKKDNIVTTLQNLEPKHKEYIALKNALPSFLDSMDKTIYSYVIYPNKDSVQLVQSVIKRIYQSGLIEKNYSNPDSTLYSNTIIKYQKSKGLKLSGKMNTETAKSMNTSDWYKFKRIAATMDRYKTLNSTMPETYVWVNLPSYKLKVINHDTLVMTSKVIIGKPTNRTPELNSEISNIVLYPTWSVPYSIAVKEMLPIAKRNPGYFAKRGFKVFNSRGKQIDPYSINWNKYTKNVPFNFKQNEGGGNALGVIKFNFENPYAVYLHDTNQRYMFERTSRALSHGCVRVNLWDSMARFLIKNAGAYYPNVAEVKKDSIVSTGDSTSYTQNILKDSTIIIADSLQKYMAPKKNMALIMQKKVPIFIRYYGCEAINGKIVFFDDVYGEDKTVIDQIFAKK